MTSTDTMAKAVRQHIIDTEARLEAEEARANHLAHLADTYRRDINNLIKFASAGWILFTVCIFLLLTSK